MTFVGGCRLVVAIPPQPHIERALAAMRDMRFLETEDDVAQLGQAQPMRHLPAQHAACAGMLSGTRAFAGDDQNEARLIMLGAACAAMAGVLLTILVK